MSSIFNTFESPASGTTITSGNSSNADGSTAFNGTVIGTGGTLVTDTTHAAHGSQAMKVASGGTAAQTYAFWDNTSLPFSGSPGTLWGRCYVYFTANPSAGFPVCQMLDHLTNLIARVTINSSGKVVMNFGASNAVATTSTASIALNQWVRLEWKVIASTTVGQTEVKLFNTTESATPTETNTSAATLAMPVAVIEGARVGLNGTAASLGPVWIDDPIFSDTAYPGPFAAPVSVAGSTPNVVLAAPVGSVSTGVNVAGSTPNVALGAPVGAPAAGVNVAGSVTNIAIAAPVGSVAASGSVTVNGTTVNVLVQMLPGAVTLIPPHIFRPPTIKLRPADPQGERLWLYYGTDQGISVIKNHDGTYTQQMFPTTDQINAAAFVYMGGHEYQVDDDEYAALVAAGYLANFGNNGSAGAGTFGSGSFGP